MDIHCFNGRLYRLAEIDSVPDLDKSITSTYFNTENGRFVECYYDPEKELWIQTTKTLYQTKVLTTISYHAPNNLRALIPIEDEANLVDHLSNVISAYNPNSHLLFYPKLTDSSWE